MVRYKWDNGKQVLLPTSVTNRYIQRIYEQHTHTHTFTHLEMSLLLKSNLSKLVMADSWSGTLQPAHVHMTVMV